MTQAPATRAALVIAAALFGACEPTPTRLNDEFLAMGTTVSITIGGRAPEDAQQAVDAAKDELKRVGREWYAWGQSGELVELNKSIAAGERSTVSSDLADLLTRSAAYFSRSDGAFDPAAGGLVRVWGFDAAERGTHSAPTDKQLSGWQRDHPTFADVTIEGLSVSSRRRDLIIDLGAIGKGFAVDRAIALLRARGVLHALVNAGGNLRAISDGSGNPWRIAIRDPRGVRALAWLELRGDESVSTSGDYERFALVKGKRIHHLVDPRSGRVADHTVAVTVVALDATLADAASTAIFVAGKERWRVVAQNMGIDQVLRIDADGTIESTPRLGERLQFKSSEVPQTGR
jgi:thiamine biosynthesis lipoprotein